MHYLEQQEIDIIKRKEAEATAEVIEVVEEPKEEKPKKVKKEDK